MKTRLNSKLVMAAFMVCGLSYVSVQAMTAPKAAGEASASATVSTTTTATTTGPASTTAADTSLKVVSSDKVCMVNDQYMGRDQIPVKHAGKTYYGCCENCKKTLAESASARTAKDPVSGKTVDKASAVIAMRADGSVLYFESQKTFDRYGKTSSAK